MALHGGSARLQWPKAALAAAFIASLVACGSTPPTPAPTPQPSLSPLAKRLVDDGYARWLATYLAAAKVEATDPKANPLDLTITYPGGGVTEEVTIKVTDGQQYTPTPGELAAGTAGRALNVSLTHSFSINQVTVSLSFFVASRATSSLPSGAALLAAYLVPTRPSSESPAEGGPIPGSTVSANFHVEAGKEGVKQLGEWGAREILGASHHGSDTLGNGYDAVTGVADAWDLGQAGVKSLQRLKELRQEAEDPANPLTQKAYEDDPASRQRSLDTIDSAITEQVVDTVVEAGGAVIGGIMDIARDAVGLGGGPYGGPVISAVTGTLVEDATERIREASEERLREIEQLLTGADNPGVPTVTPAPPPTGLHTPPPFSTESLKPAPTLPPLDCGHAKGNLCGQITFTEDSDWIDYDTHHIIRSVATINFDLLTTGGGQLDQGSWYSFSGYELHESTGPVKDTCVWQGSGVGKFSGQTMPNGGTDSWLGFMNDEPPMIDGNVKVPTSSSGNCSGTDTWSFTGPCNQGAWTADHRSSVVDRSIVFDCATVIQEQVGQVTGTAKGTLTVRGSSSGPTPEPPPSTRPPSAAPPSAEPPSFQPLLRCINPTPDPITGAQATPCVGFFEITLDQLLNPPSCPTPAPGQAPSPCSAPSPDCSLSHAGPSIVWSGCDLTAASLPGANLSGADMARANLPGANLSGADLSGADLFGANLSGADLSGANLFGAFLYNANLTGAKLSGTNLVGADFSGGNLGGASLNDAKLANANLIGTDLSGADLTGVSLGNTDLTYASLNQVAMTEAGVTGGIWNSAICPDGTRAGTEATATCLGHLLQ